MWYLFFQIWIWLVAAFVLGWLAHWFLCCRGRDNDSESSGFSANTGESVTDVSVMPVVEAATQEIDDSWKPQGFANAPENKDDLKRIKGIGSVIEETLNGLGIYQFNQISQWSDNNIAWIENFLAFPGRIAREDWKNQAKTLSDGGTTEFAQRVDKGDIDYR